MDLTVQLTQQNAVTATLPTGRKLTLRIASLPHGTRYLMEGAPTGSHDIDINPSVTSPERLLAHWNSYVHVAMTSPEERAALEKLMDAARLKRSEEAMREASRKLEVQARQLAAIASGPQEAGLSGPGGITVRLRACEVFPHDPGEGTPAMVIVPAKGSATYWCARDMGITSSDRKDHELSPAQVDWLNSYFVEEAVGSFIHVWTKRIEKNPKLRPSR